MQRKRPPTSRPVTGATDTAATTTNAPLDDPSNDPLAGAPCAAAPMELEHALGHTVADKRLEVLRGIQATGSISKAARAVGVSYKAAWQALDTLTNLAGVALVERSVGGVGGGGTRLTSAGAALLDAAQTLAQARHAAVQQVQVRREAAAAGAAAQTGARRDAVGAGVSPAVAAGLALRTSMRNQWPAVVAQVQVHGPLAVVRLQAGEGQVLVQARLTAESAQLLGLQAGQPMLVMAKATAMEVMPAGAVAAAPAGANHWLGTATRVRKGDAGDEVAVHLPGGVQVVGFAGAGSGLRKGRKVQVVVPASAVVLAAMEI